MKQLKGRFDQKTVTAYDRRNLFFNRHIDHNNHLNENAGNCISYITKYYDKRIE